MTAVWTPQADPGDRDQGDIAEAAAQWRRANRDIRRRALCEHGGYTGTDPITEAVLCAICRRTGERTTARPAKPATSRTAARTADQGATQ